MKKIFVILLTLALILSFSACNKADNAYSATDTSIPTVTSSTSSIDESNTSSIHKTSNITSDESSIINEQSSVNTQTANSSSNSFSTTNQNDSPCDHAYYLNKVITSTCVEQGYKIYICIRCNDTYNENIDYAAHTFNNYRCTLCGEVDKEHTFEYFAYWISKNGTANSEYCEINYTENERTYSITYNEQSKEICMSVWSSLDSHYTIHNVTDKYKVKATTVTTIYMDSISKSYEYESNTQGTDMHFSYTIQGNINSNSFTKDTQLSYKKSGGGGNIGLDFTTELSVAQYNITSILTVVNGILNGEFRILENSGISIADFGFNSFLESVN